MAAWDIQGRDAFSATSGTGAVNFAPINIGIAAGAGSSSSSGAIGTLLGGSVSPLLLIGGALVLLLLLAKHGKRLK